MNHYLLRRFLLLFSVLWGVATAVFFTLRLIPGDPVDWILGEGSLSVDRQALRAQMGLDRPLWEQYGSFLGDLMHLDFGRSYFSQRLVLDLIAEKLPATIELGAFSLVIALALALPLGILAAVRYRTWKDHAAMFLTLLGISLPSFWLGPLLILFFSIHLMWLPPSGRSQGLSFFLPALTLGLGMAAVTARMTRASLLEVLDLGFVTTARAKGVREFWVICHHALRNSLIPVVTIVGLQSGILLTGAIVTEKIFSWPGMGSLLLQAIERRDFAVIQACVLVFAVAYVLINTLTDIFYAVLDPRVKETFAQRSFLS